jgi:hypothetical protein
MKKILVLCFAVLFSSLILKSQNFEILDSDNQVITGTTIVVPINVNASLGVDIKIRNLSSNQVSAKISKTFTAGPVEGSYNTMCSPTTTNSAGACVTGSSTNSFILDPNETSQNAEMHFDQGPNPGVSTVRYKVYNVSNESDFVYVTYTFSTYTSVPVVNSELLKVYPNPASKSFSIEHSLGSKAYVEIYNMLGKLVYSAKSESQLSNIDCSKWENGYYFCRLFNDGKIEKTIKLVVTR